MINSPVSPARTAPAGRSTSTINHWLAARLKGSRPALVISLVTSLLGACAVIAQASLTGQVVVAVFLEGSSLAQEWQALSLLLGLLLVRAVLTYASERAAQVLAAAIQSSLRRELFDTFFRRGPAFVREGRVANLANASLTGIEQLEAWYSQFLPQLFLAALIPAAILLFVFPLDRLSGSVLLVTAPLLPFFMVLIGRSAERLTQRRWAVLGRLGHYFLDTLQGLATLKAFGRAQERVYLMKKVNEDYRRKTMSVLRLTFLSALALELIATLSMAVVAVEIGLRLLNDSLAYQPALTILLLAPEFYLPLRQLSQRFHASRSGVSAAAGILELLDGSLPPEAPARQEPPARSAPIHCKAVSLAHPDRSRPALDGITLEIQPGERVAVLGATGAGKSSLFHLLLKFEQPTAGRIRIAGMDLAGIADEDWRRQVAWVPQQPAFFNATLEDNLRLGDPAATRTQVESACRLAGLAGWLARLPAGLGTPVGESGQRLSGGQARRLALARALLKILHSNGRVKLLLMDEAGAGLDPETQLQPAALLSALPADLTVMSITHHLGGLSAFGRVLVLSEGRLFGDMAPEAYLRALRSRTGSRHA